MKTLIPLLFHLLLSFSSLYAVVSFGGRCPDCGGTHVPYPLSTHPHCGDPSYKLRCDGHTLWLDTLNASSYPITSIHPETQRFVVRPPGLAARDTCVSRDFKTQGMWLDTNAPFNITSSNTLILMNKNCSQEVLSLLWNCSSSSLCYRYVAADRVVGPACGGGGICCTIKTGGSTTEYRIRVRKERCAAYVSLPNLDESAPMSEWPEPGVEIEWELPEEPVCVAAADCIGLGNSACLPVLPGRGGGRRCLCNSGFQWDPVNGICQEIKCESGRRCKLRNKKKIQLIGGFAFAGVAMLAGTLISTIVSLHRRRRHGLTRGGAQLSTSMTRDILNGDKSCKVFTIKEITKATDNFAKHNLLGSGGFGEVFKGVLDDGTVTAIKRARLGSTRAADQLLNEVRILCQVNHRHLVRLLGFCLDLSDEPLLVYEFVPNGTLFDCLHRVDAAKWAPLTWHRRLRIAHQTAQGLAYLHDACVPRIFHRDVKSSNILLDNNLDAKVSDFGVSRLAISEATHVTTCAQGTLGYLDPEYYINFQVTDKSDVYSFGVVLLEMLTAKKALDFGREEEDVNLVVFVKRAMRNGRLMDVIDPTVRNEAGGKMEVESMKALGCLAEACLDDRRQNRPSMKQVTDEIQYILSLLTTTTTQTHHPPQFQVSCHDNGDFEIFSATDPFK